jgi:glucosylglycerate synthase
LTESVLDGGCEFQIESLGTVPEETFLPDELLRQLMSVGEVDLLVGVSASTSLNVVRPVLQAIEQAFQQQFFRQRVVIVSMDGSTNHENGQLEIPDITAETRGRVHGLTSLRTIHQVRAGFTAPPDPGGALRTILACSDLLHARACAVVSPFTSNLTPEWIAKLLAPVFREKFDFVAPLYRRHKYQGLLIRNLLYPMSRAVFGCGIREIFASEYAFSGRVAAYCLDQDVWHEEPIRARPEGWMAITANVTNFRCCQVFLGDKLAPAAGPSVDIVAALRETVGTLFWCLEKSQALWMNGEDVQPVPTFGAAQQLTSEPTDMDRHRIFEMFRSGVSDLAPILSSILDPETYSEIKNILSIEEGKFRFKPDLWVRTLYDFAAAYHHAVINRDHVVQALAPLYRGMTHSFLVEHSNSSPAEIEAADEMLCSEFELQKPYLREKWNARAEVKS